MEQLTIGHMQKFMNCLEKQVSRKNKEREMKKRLLLTLVLTLLLSSVVYALPAIDFNYWYSNANDIYYWSDSSLNVFTHPYESDMSASALNGYVSTAFTKWNSSTGLTKSFVSSQSSAQIEVLGISRTTARTLDLPDDVIGVGLSADKTWTANGYYNGDPKDIFETKYGCLYFVDDPITGGFGPTEWERLIVHEMGHVFGYIGHYTDGVMKTNFNDITTSNPSTKEKLHIKQVY